MLQTRIDVPALRGAVHLTDPHTVTALTTAPGRILVGLADGDQPHYLRDEHVLVATGGAGGTTTLLRSIAAQALRQGRSVDLLDLDRRRPSHPWAQHVPGARLHSSAAEVQALVLDLRDELLRSPERDDSTEDGQRLLVIENADRVLDALRQHYLVEQPDTQAEEAPAVEALAELLYFGRAHGLQIVAASARGIPPHLGVSLREQFTTRIVACAGTSLWTRIAPEIWPVPPNSIIPGRMHLVRDDTAYRLQALYLSEAEAHAWARGTVFKEYR